MKVLISRKDLKDTTSGVPRIVLQELEFFHSRGHSTYAIAESINNDMISDCGGHPVKTFKWPFSGYFRRKFYQFQVNNWISKNKPELVIGHGDILHQDVLFIHNCVHLAHELIEGKPLPKDHEVGKIHKQILTSGSYKVLVCNSEMMRNDLIKRFDLSADKVTVMYPEFKPDRFNVNEPSKSKQEWRSHFNFNEDDFVIGMVTSGNFKKRNLGLLIEAFKEVYKIEPRARLFIAGRNIDQKYIQQANGFPVTFAPPTSDVKLYYNMLDVFVLPAHIEEFGLSVLESMYCRIPVIITSHVGAGELLQGQSREFIMEKPDLGVLVNLILRFRDKEISKRVTELNYKTSLEFSAKIQENSLGRILEKIGL